MHETLLTLPVEPPFRLDLTVWVLRRHAKNSIDSWDGQTYCRVFTLGGVPALAAISQKDSILIVKLKSDRPNTAVYRAELEKLIRRTLGLDINLKPFYKLTASDTMLTGLVQQFVGVRPPKFPSVFEALLNAIACQQVSLNAGILLLSRLADRYGKSLTNGKTTLHAFPEPLDLAAVNDEALKQLGFSHQKSRAIRNLAYKMANDDINLGQLESAGNNQAISVLQSIHGIGRWSAEYVLLRGLGRLDVFPGDDLGGQNNLRLLLGLDTRPSYEELRKLTASWNPYAGFIYFHLLLSKLQDKELI